MSRSLWIPTRIESRHDLAATLRTLSQFGLAATIVLTPFRYRFVLAARPLSSVYGDYTDYLLFASDVALAITLALWLLGLALQPRSITSGPRFLSFPLAGVLAAGLISGFSSVDPGLSMYHLLRLILLAGFYLYLLNEVDSLRWVVIPVTLQLLVQSLVGLAQVLSQRSVGLAALGEWTLDPAWRGVSVVWADGVRVLRAYGLSDHPNILGGCLAFGLIVLIGYAVRSEDRWHPIRTVAIGLAMTALFFTYSRTAWLAFAIGMLVFGEGLRRLGRDRTLRDWLVLMAAGAIVVFPFVWQNAASLGVRLNVGDSFTQITIEQRSISERRELNAAANEIFAANALTGVGLGAFPTALSMERPNVPYDYQPPHFALLEAAAETGIFGALVYFLALVLPWLAVWLNRERIEFTPAFLSLSAALAAVTVAGMFDYYPWLLAPGRLWQVLIWALWAASYRAAREKVKHA